METVLILTDVMSIGGVEKVIINTLNGLDYSKFDVTLLIMYKTEGEKSNIQKLNKNVKVQYLFQKPLKGKYQRILYQLLRFFPHTIINNFIVKEKYDIIVTTKDVFSYPISANKAYKVMWVHGGLDHLEEAQPFFNKLKRWYQRSVYGKFDSVILLTKEAYKRFSTTYGIKKGHVLHNPINNEEIYKLSNEEVNDYNFTSDLTVISSCRLSSEKGVIRLVNSAVKLLNNGIKFKLLILGDGPERKKIEEKIKESKIGKENITLLGFKENPFKYIKQSDIFVSCSYTEGFPLSVAEALILGKAIVGTKCSGNEDMLENGKHGLIVENNEEGIYKGLKQMLLNKQLLEFYKNKSDERRTLFNYSNNIRLFEKYISRKVQ